jgi:hypothetical protein
LIAQDALVSAGDNVSIRAHEEIDFGAFAGGVAVGAGGIGGSVVVANVRSHTDAHVASGATVTAGGDPVDEILVSATLTENVTGAAFAGQLGAVTLGAQVVVINDTGEQSAYIEDGATISEASKLTVSASATRALDAKARARRRGAFGLRTLRRISGALMLTLAARRYRKQCPGHRGYG